MAPTRRSPAVRFAPSEVVAPVMTRVGETVGGAPVVVTPAKFRVLYCARFVPAARTRLPVEVMMLLA